MNQEQLFIVHIHTCTQVLCSDLIVCWSPKRHIGIAFLKKGESPDGIIPIRACNKEMRHPAASSGSETYQSRLADAALGRLGFAVPWWLDAPSGWGLFGLLFGLFDLDGRHARINLVAGQVV